MNADVQGTAKWIELNQTGNSCASVQSAFPAVVACYAMFFKSKLRSRNREAAATKFPGSGLT